MLTVSQCHGLSPLRHTLSCGILVTALSGLSTRMLRTAVRFPRDVNSKKETHTIMKSRTFQPAATRPYEPKHACIVPLLRHLCA
jgi:hypothetical protein